MADEQRRREPPQETRRDTAPDRADTAPRGGIDPESGRRLGGHELPDAVQDRPEQNAGYDEAVHGAPQGLVDPDGEARNTDSEIAGDLAASAAEEDPAEAERRRRFAQIDDAAANDAAQTVRRRDRGGDIH